MRYGPADVDVPARAVDARRAPAAPGPVHLDFDPTATGPATSCATDGATHPSCSDWRTRDVLGDARRPVVVAGVGARG